MDTAALKASWANVVAAGDDVPLYFYSHLFLSHPEVRAMFPIQMSGQRDKLVAALGAVLASRVADKISTGLAGAGLPASGDGSGSLDLAHLPPAVATVVRTAYADATGQIFLIAGLIAIVTFVAVWLMPVTELRTTIRKVEEPQEDPEEASV